MMERKLYKTKLCILYQRGRCSRQSCSFAHGDAELRRPPPGAMNGRREYRGGDLRDKLERRHSPYRRYSPGRDFRGRPAFHNPKQLSHDRGFSPSRSPMRRSNRRHARKVRPDGQSDASRSPKSSDDEEDHPKERKTVSSDEKYALEEKLREVQLDFEGLEDSKTQLQIELKEMNQEADELFIKIQDLESQLNKEREDCRRLTSKNKKFIKALGRYLRAQEELKRSQTRLQRLTDQFGSDALKHGTNEEDSGVNILSDGEPNHISDRHENHNHDSPLKKRPRLSTGTSEETKPGSAKIRERFFDRQTVPDRAIGQSENSKKAADALNASVKSKFHKLIAEDTKQRTGKSSASGASADKVRVSEIGNLLPSTSIAAHAADELIDAVEIDEKPETVEATVVSQNGTVDVKSGPPCLPPPPPKVAPNSYNQYEGDDEDIDVVEVDNDIGDTDLNDAGI